MKLTILFFGITTDLVNASSKEMELTEGICIGDFKELLKTNYPQLQHIHSYSIAVNEAYASDEVVLKANDVVAIIPPVSGG